VNQSWVQFKKGAFAAIGGRQGIVLDNQRFIGMVAWRQNEQTYDAGALKLGSLPRTQLFYSYVGRVNRVTGPDNGTFPGNFDSNSHLVNAKIDLGAFGAVTLFDYLLDFGNLALQLTWHDFQAEASSDDYGSEWDASAGYKFGTRYEVLARYASYMADGFATDTTKIWIQLSAAF
jgi:hypothetical protein